MLSVTIYFAVIYPEIAYNAGGQRKELSYSQGTQHNQDGGYDRYINNNAPGSPKYGVSIEKY